MTVSLVPKLPLEVAPESFIFRVEPGRQKMRRAFDVVVAACSLPVIAPVLYVACLAIAIEDGGPFLFQQRRVGLYERKFTILKLRTMRKDLCGDELKPTSGRDPRITRVGAVLRKLSIDELPQLFNVLRGDMSVVGPRPEMPFVVEGYDRWQNLRHLVKPGLTCLWQTTVRSTVPLHHPEATALDLSYIRHRSVLMDLQILKDTVGSVLGTRGAH